MFFREVERLVWALLFTSLIILPCIARRATESKTRGIWEYATMLFAQPVKLNHRPLFERFLLASWLLIAFVLHQVWSGLIYSSVVRKLPYFIIDNLETLAHAHDLFVIVYPNETAHHYIETQKTKDPVARSLASRMMVLNASTDDKSYWNCVDAQMTMIGTGLAALIADRLYLDYLRDSCHESWPDLHVSSQSKVSIPYFIAYSPYLDLEVAECLRKM